MLVLQRKESQAIVLDGGIVVRVLSIHGDSVKLGIDAPHDVRVLREELVRQDGGDETE